MLVVVFCSLNKSLQHMFLNLFLFLHELCFSLRQLPSHRTQFMSQLLLDLLHSILALLQTYIFPTCLYHRDFVTVDLIDIECNEITQH